VELSPSHTSPSATQPSPPLWAGLVHSHAPSTALWLKPRFLPQLSPGLLGMLPWVPPCLSITGNVQKQPSLPSPLKSIRHSIWWLNFSHGQTPAETHMCSRTIKMDLCVSLSPDHSSQVGPTPWAFGLWPQNPARATGREGSSGEVVVPREWTLFFCFSGSQLVP
jgi:hypothetical protein